MVKTTGFDSFIDAIYDAVIEPTLWRQVLKRFSDELGGSSAALRWCDAFDGTGTGINSRNDEVMGKLYLEHYVHCNPLRTPAHVMKRRLVNWVPRIAADEAWMPRAALKRTEYYNDFLQKFELEWDLSISLDAEGTKVGFINTHRSARQGPHDNANFKFAAAAQPHFIRAFQLSRRLAKSGALAPALVDIVDRSPHGIFLLDNESRVWHLNLSAEKLVAEGDSFKIVGGQLIAANHKNTQKLHTLIGRASANERIGRIGGSMSMETPERRLPLSVIVAPLRGEKTLGSFYNAPSVMVCVTDLETGMTLPEARLHNLFGLTPAEIRVVLALFEGLDPRQAAEHLGISFHTVRGHLVHIYAKTRTNGQSDLARLMMRISEG